MGLISRFISHSRKSVHRVRWDTDRSFLKLKPFYIHPCKASDIQTCCCTKHVNFRNSIEALLKELSHQKLTVGSNSESAVFPINTDINEDIETIDFQIDAGNNILTSQIISNLPQQSITEQAAASTKKLFKDYRTFTEFIYKHCSRDNQGLLVK